MDESNNTQVDPADYIEKIKEDLANSFKDVDINNPTELLDYLQKNYVREVPDLDSPKKLISCPHEIIFDIKATVMEENEKGEVVGCKEICRKDYHIPVPPKKDYNLYMESFFEYLEKCITSSIKHSEEKVEDVK
jgi:phosphatidylethanolamine-binding protein (PEBP) family uncharacterized protein